MKRQRTPGFKPVSKKVRFFVTMPLTGVLSQCKINIKSLKFSGGCAPDVDRSAVLYAILIGCKNVRYVGQINVLVETNIWGIKSFRGRLKPIRAQKAYKKKQKKWRPFFCCFLETVKFLERHPCQKSWPRPWFY